MSLQGKTAVVTGGARGIGWAYCERLSGDGANVVVSDKDDATALLPSRTGTERSLHSSATLESHGAWLWCIAPGVSGLTDFGRAHASIRLRTRSRWQLRSVARGRSVLAAGVR